MAAEDTAAMLQQAAHGGVPVLIPGAFERRSRHPATRPTDTPADSAGFHARTAVVGERERLQYEREGGGAPRERTPGRHRTMLARLWHCMFHPADVSLLWRQRLPQER